MLQWPLFSNSPYLELDYLGVNLASLSRMFAGKDYTDRKIPARKYSPRTL